MSDYIDINGTTHQLYQDEGYAEWIGPTPICLCGEPLERHDSRKGHIRAYYYDDYRVYCESCEREYPIQEDRAPRTEAEAAALIIGGAKVTL